MERPAYPYAGIAQTAERAMQAHRMHSHRTDKKQEAVMAVLQQLLDIRGK
jgi:hypothetical protein